MTAPVLWICGPPCIGKSAVGWEVLLQTMHSGRKAAYLDADQVGFFRTYDHHDLIAANLHAAWRNFREGGAGSLIISSPQAEDLDPDLVPTVCRLRATPEELIRRIRRRAGRDSVPLPGDVLPALGPAELDDYIKAALDTAQRLDLRGAADFVLDTNGLSPDEVALRIRSKWPT